ncbi:MAG: response regulator [Polyangiaceae bacterium]|jgi:CheY-like chemotaxis protein|nr:response regulator [Polyangiaceae bacterium]MBK8938312.1 response regulator [Polyangiaceae bacterium]
MAVSSAAEREPQRTSEREPSGGRERLGGARADFVANLGKRRVELRGTLDALRADPSSKRYAGELRRRVHALAAGAKLLRFSMLADELKLVEAKLEEAAHRGSLEASDFGAVHDLVGRMTSLAWGQTEEEPVAARSSAERDPLAHLRRGEATEAASQRVPCSVLVVGGSHLADPLSMPMGRSTDDDGQAFEVERTAEASVGLDLARALAPDVAVIDGDLPDAKALVQDLAADPLTESVPIIVALRLARADDAGPFLALGVARVLPKPVSPSELRRACAGVVSTYVKREVSREPLGDLTLDQLGARLAEELRRGLCDTVQADARSSTLKLGEGTELLAALWGAVARIRDVVTIRTQGQVRFANGGPEGAVPMAPWLDAPDVTTVASKRGLGRAARAETETSLEKLRVLVADDDAAVCWFLAGVLKTAGATVYEARDGERALEIAKHVNPDLIISDILMPRMDGFNLSRIVRRDVVLRDVPIVLLSWKEDLLQRVRELGADADGYLRKEASAGAIVQRAKELVRQRRRVAQRIATQGEVRGRLDGLTTHTLLRLVCQLRESSTVSVRDASYLYEVEIRGGKPIRATRTALDGSFERGAGVLAALLGAGDGRFSVSPPREDGDVGPVRHELSGSLTDQVMPVVASARAAQRLLSGANLMRVQRVEVDDEAIQSYLAATPHAARTIVETVARGACPRDLVTNGAASARLLEDVLIDAAVHGGIIQILDASGEDRLPGATALELAILRGERTVSPIASLPVLGVGADAQGPLEPAPWSDRLREVIAQPSQEAPVVFEVQRAPSVIDAAGNLALFSRSAPPPRVAPAPAEPTAADAARSRSAEPPVVERRQTPAPVASAPSDDVDPWDELPVDVAGSSLAEDPRDASPVPASGPRLLTPPPQTRLESPRELTPTPSHIPLPPGVKPMLTLGSLHPPPVTESAAVPTPRPKNVKKSPTPAPVAAKEGPKDKTELTPRFPLPSAFLSSNNEPRRRDRKTTYWIAFALIGVVFAVWARWSRERSHAAEQALGHEVAGRPAAESQPVDPTVAQATTETDGAPDPAAGARDLKPDAPKPKSEEIPVEELPLRDGDRVKKGQGLLEIVAGKSDTIYVDGKAVGSGPVITMPLKARTDPYEIKLKTRGEEKTRFVTVKESKMVRLRMAPPWQR